MENVLQDIPQVGVYLDDILIGGRTETEHLTILEQVLVRLKQAGLRLLLLWKKRTNDGCPLCHKRQTLLHVLNNTGLPGHVGSDYKVARSSLCLS